MTGIGTRMTVRLLLTLAILDGMSVAIGEHIYIPPLSYVIESLQPEPGCQDAFQPCACDPGAW